MPELAEFYPGWKMNPAYFSDGWNRPPCLSLSMSAMAIISVELQVPLLSQSLQASSLDRNLLLLEDSSSTDISLLPLPLLQVLNTELESLQKN